MFDFVDRHFGVKIFLSYLVVILIGALVLGLVTAASLPRAFNRHMSGMMQALQAASNVPGGGRGAGRGAAQGARMLTLYNNFRASFTEALKLAAGAALAAALAASAALSRSVVVPVQALQSASQRIAAGHYDERVQVTGTDELGQLAQSFNRMAGELEQVEEMRRRLIADIAHELRTPLTAIRGSTEGLLDGVLPASEDTFRQIHQEAVRLSHLVDDLQELSRVESGAYKLTLRPVTLSDVVQTVSKRLSLSLTEKRLHLTPSLPADLPPLLADEDRLIQILTNLLGNAIQYTPAGGAITVSARLEEGQVQISVQDTGVGIPAEHLAHIFDRFYRVDKSRSRQHGGSGIGLTITRYLVEAHGGRIWAESAGEGQGSTFHFTIPACMG
ncbi:MAG: sensor histidine kinase [Candidatus Villigracilaceae bacterium]